MKHSNLFLWLFLLCIIISTGKLWAQSEHIGLYYKDSLAIYKKNNDLIGYLEVLDEIHNYFLRNKDFDSINLLSKEYILFRDPNNSEEKKKARFSFTLNGFTYYNKIGDNIRALKYYELAHENLEKKLEGDNLSWYIENVIGNIYTRLEEYEKAGYFFNIVERYLLSTGNDKNRSRLFVNKSRSLNAQGKTDAAISILKKAKQITSDENAHAGIYLNLVDLMLAVNKIDSSQLYFDSFDKLKDQVRDERLFYYYELLGDKYCKQEKYTEALSAYDMSYERLVKKFGTGERRECAKLLNKKSKVYLALKDFERAAAILQTAFYALNDSYDKVNQSLPTINQVYPENTYYELLFQYAFVAFEKYNQSHSIQDLYQAQDAIFLGIQVNRMLGYSYLTTPSKLISIEQNRMLVDIGMDVLYELSVNEGVDNWLNEVNEMFDFSKSLNLVDRVVKRNRLLSMRGNERDSIGRLQNQLTDLYLAKSNVTDNLLVDSLGGIIFSKEEEVESLLGGGLNEIVYDVGSLPNFIEYVSTSDFVYSLNNFGTFLEFKRNCTIAKFNELHKEFNSYISNKGELSDRNALVQLREILLPDLEKRLDKVTVIPDGLISTIPFDILIDSEGRYLIENFTFFYALHKFQLAKTIGTRDEMKSIYAVNPNYSSVQSASVRGGKYQLEHADFEIQNIQNLFPKAYYTSIKFSEDEILNNLKNADMFHFSGHAIVENDKAYLILSNEENDYLTFTDLSEQFLDLELVVLSACETGLGEFAYGDGLQSLARAFMQAGAKTVVNSLWTVNDKSTSNLSRKFYKAIRSGQGIDVALRNAKLNYLKESPIENQHPYYWAGLVGVGDNSPLNLVQSPLNNWCSLLVIVFVILLAWRLFLNNKIKK